MANYTQEWVWPDVQAVLVGALSGVDADHVGSRLPDPLPATIVRVQRIGGVRGQVQDTARCVIECWGTWALCSQVRDTLRRLPATGAVDRVDEVSAPGLYSDAVSGRDYWLFTVQATLRPAPAPAP